MLLLMDSTQYRIRPFKTETDLQTVSGWWSKHRNEDLPVAALPPLGVVVADAVTGEPVAALWCYECYGVGVAFIEFPVAKPGLQIGELRRVFDLAINAVIVLAGQFCDPPGEYRLFRCATNQTIARILDGMGFERGGDAVCPMQLIIPPREEEPQPENIINFNFN